MRRLRRRSGAGHPARDEPRVAASLPKTEERLERREDAAAALELLERLGAGRGQDAAIQLLLLRPKLRMQDDLGPGRKLGRDLALEAAEDEGLDPGAHAGGIGARPLAESLAGPEEAGIEELELAPEIV